MTAPVKQIQMVYSPEEDRILLRLNSADGAEFRFWLTRRYAQLMAGLLARHIDLDPDISTQSSVEARQAVREFKHDQAVQQADFEQAFEENEVSYPLGATAILAFRLTGKRIAKDLQLGIHPKEGQGVTIVLNHALNASISELLKRAIKQAQWNVQTALQNMPETPSVKIIN